MSEQTMAEVLTAHVVITDGLYEPTGWCATCGNLADGDQENHQAFALSASGFGKTSAAEVWDEAATVLYMGKSIGPELLQAMFSRNPYKAAK